MRRLESVSRPEIARLPLKPPSWSNFQGAIVLVLIPAKLESAELLTPSFVSVYADE